MVQKEPPPANFLALGLGREVAPTEWLVNMSRDDGNEDSVSQSRGRAGMGQWSLRGEGGLGLNAAPFTQWVPPRGHCIDGPTVTATNHWPPSASSDTGDTHSATCIISTAQPGTAMATQQVYKWPGLGPTEV